MDEKHDPAEDLSTTRAGEWFMCGASIVGAAWLITDTWPAMLDVLKSPRFQAVAVIVLSIAVLRGIVAAIRDRRG